MVEAIMYMAIGFLVASLGLVVFVPLVHYRAVRLTTRKIEHALPGSNEEIVALHDLARAEFAMSTRRLETAIDELKTKNMIQLIALSKTEDRAHRLKIENSALRYRVRVAEADIASKILAFNEIEQILSVKEPELERTTKELNVKSAQNNAQTVELVALQTQVGTLKDQLAAASKELTAVDDRRSVETTSRELRDEHDKFDIFHRQVADIKQNLIARDGENTLFSQVPGDSERLLAMQSRLLEEREYKLENLQRELEFARKIEAELRAEIVSGDDCLRASFHSLQAEKDKLKGMLERAQAECARLTYELTSLKRKIRNIEAA